MTDRLKGATVVFTADIRDDDAESILNAIRMIKGVLAVTGVLSDSDDWMNRRRIQAEMRQRVSAALAALELNEDG